MTGTRLAVFAVFRFSHPAFTVFLCMLFSKPKKFLAVDDGNYLRITWIEGVCREVIMDETNENE